MIHAMLTSWQIYSHFLLTFNWLWNCPYCCLQNIDIIEWDQQRENWLFPAFHRSKSPSQMMWSVPHWSNTEDVWTIQWQSNNASRPWPELVLSTCTEHYVCRKWKILSRHQTVNSPWLQRSQKLLRLLQAQGHPTIWKVKGEKHKENIHHKHIRSVNYYNY